MSATPRPTRTTATQHPLVLEFAAIDSKMLPAVGGKAANLGELTRAGFPVSQGLCVTTEAYGQVAKGAVLEGVLAALAGTSPSDIALLGVLADAGRAAVLTAPVPAHVTAAILDGYRRLAPDAAVAVRSSATAEDLPFASFAGQQDTFLNVIGDGAVLDAVRRCWASLWTDRAVVYRASNGVDHRTVRLAVVIQRMVDARVAGVMFTANPVTGRRRQASIDASPGLGESVVSGAVNPDHFIVDTLTGEILERRLGDKRAMIRPLPGGGTEQVLNPEPSGRACITDEQIRTLAALGRRVETCYGSPQDTEWALDREGKLWLTQARPITTLFPLPASAPQSDEQLRVYFCFSVAQGLYRPITPMGLAAFRLIASSGARLFGFPVSDPLAGPHGYVEAGQRVYADLTGTLRGRVGRTLAPAVLDVMEARSAAILRGLLHDPRLSVTQPSRLPFMGRVLRVALRYGIPLRIIEALARPGAARARAERIGANLISRLEMSSGATATERLDFVERVLLTEIATLGPRLLPLAAVGLGMLGVAGKLLGTDANHGDLQTVLRGLPYNITTEMDLELWQLAGRIRGEPEAARLLQYEPAADLARRFGDGTLPRIVQHGLAGFLGKYGHRAVAEIDLGLPRWSDDPQHLLGVLGNYLRLGNSELDPDALFARGASEAEEMIATLVSRARRRGRLRARLVALALRRSRQLAGLREMPKYNMIVVLAAARRQLAGLGDELARAGRIAAPDDIFFLDLTEVRAALRGRAMHARVNERRQVYVLELRRRHVPRVLLSDGTEPETATNPASGSGALVGTPASAGIVTGTARVILDPVGAHLEPGEILVAPSTDPGWTPLFLTASGLVMEMGGSNSHGAVVAREYGIPAVVGVAQATDRLVTGRRITVDGSAGTVVAH